MTEPTVRSAAVAMKIGLFAINHGTCGDPETAVEVARAAEAAGLESVWTGEHIVVPDRVGQFAPTLDFLDTTVALTLVATHTTTLRVASGIIVLPLRNPIVLAKQLASVDVVSRGRLSVGVAAGYVREEFSASGVPFDERQARMTDYVGALRDLWGMEHPLHRGPFVSFAGIDAYPRPVQRPCPPLIVGGESRAALVRAVTLADGWYGFDANPAAALATLRRIAAEHPRPDALGRLEITLTPTGPLDRAAVERYEEVGVDRLVLLPQPDTRSRDKHRPIARERVLRNIDWIAEELLA